MRRKPALLFYCQHSVGIGHLVRSLALVHELSAHFHVVFMNGGRMPASMALPPAIDIVQLPELGLSKDYELISLNEQFTVEMAQRQRRKMLVDTHERLRPDAVIIELFPFGRKKFRGELLPLLETARNDAHKALVLCSLRDILVRSRRDQQRHDDGAAATLEKYFDGVLVHADPAFARLEESFKPRIPLSVPIYYTGFVVPWRTAGAGGQAREARILVSAGSGVVGGSLLRTAVEAHARLWEREQIPMSIVAGPFLPEQEWWELKRKVEHRPGISLSRSVPDLYAELQRVRWSISQCGYNTAMEVLATRVGALFVPFCGGQEDEQLTRATRLQEYGLARLLPAARLNVNSLFEELPRLLEFIPSSKTLDLDGARKSADTVLALSGRARVNSREVAT